MPILGDSRFQLSGKRLHLAAEDITGVANGGTVETMPDSSGNGNHATQSTAGKRPTLQTNAVNGLPAVLFSASGGRIFNLPNVFSAMTAGECFFVARSNADPVNQMSPLRMGSAGTASNYPFSDGVVYDGWGSTTRKTCGDPLPWLANWRLVNIHSAPSDWAFKVDTRTLFSTTTNTVGFTTTPQFGGHDGINYFNGLIPELIVFDRKLTPTERAGIEAYFGEKYQLAYYRNVFANIPDPFLQTAIYPPTGLPGITRGVSDGGTGQGPFGFISGGMWAYGTYPTRNGVDRTELRTFCAGLPAGTINLGNLNEDTWTTPALTEVAIQMSDYRDYGIPSGHYGWPRPRQVGQSTPDWQAANDAANAIIGPYVTILWLAYYFSPAAVSQTELSPSQVTFWTEYAQEAIRLLRPGQKIATTLCPNNNGGELLIPHRLNMQILEIVESVTGSKNAMIWFDRPNVPECLAHATQLAARIAAWQRGTSVVYGAGSVVARGTVEYGNGAMTGVPGVTYSGCNVLGRS